MQILYQHIESDRNKLVNLIEMDKELQVSMIKLNAEHGLNTSSSCSRYLSLHNNSLAR